MLWAVSLQKRTVLPAIKGLVADRSLWDRDLEGTDMIWSDVKVQDISLKDRLNSTCMRAR